MLVEGTEALLILHLYYKTQLRMETLLMLKIQSTSITYVIGKTLTKPPIFRMSCSSANAWITEPAVKNSNALKKA